MIIGCLAPLIVGTIAVSYVAWGFGAFQQPPPIARDLGGAEPWRSFESRTQDMFPVGSSVRELQNTLAAQGFGHEWTYDAESGSRRDLVEVMTWRGRGCTYYQIAWKADHVGRIAWVHGSMPSMCY